MSKTVKRVMRVMMIGLVTLVGAEAEAHSVYYAGRYKYCSVCSEMQLTEQENYINPGPHTDQVKLVLEPISIEILCPNENEPKRIDDQKLAALGLPPDLLQNLSLAVQKTIAAGDITTLLNGNGGSLITADVRACVDDTALLVNSTLNSTLYHLWDQVCEGVDVKPTALLIRELRARIETSWCKNLKCNTLSTHVDDYCKLPDAFKLTKNKPQDAYYDCGQP